MSDSRADWLSAAKGGGALAPKTGSRLQCHVLLKSRKYASSVRKGSISIGQLKRFLRRSFTVTRCKILLVLFIREVQKTEM